MHCHDAAFAGGGGEVGTLGEAGVFVLETGEAEAGVLLCVFYCVGGR